MHMEPVRPSKSPVPALRSALFFARVAQGRILLDIEPPNIRRAEVVVGTVAAGADTVHGAKIINLVNVAGDPQRAHHLTRLVADELSAAFQEQRPVRQLGQRGHDPRFLLLLVTPVAGGPLQPELSNRLAIGYLKPQQRSTVLLLKRLPAPAGIKHDGSQRVGLAPLGGSKGAFDDLICLGKTES